MRKTFPFLLFCALSLGLVAQVFSQQPSTPTGRGLPPLSVEPVGRDIYEVKGGAGANAGFFVTEREVVLIDVKMTPESGGQMLAAIRRITPHALGYIILTHSDTDHVNGLSAFPRAVPVVSHENTRARMEKAAPKDLMGVRLPQITFSDRLRLYFEGPQKRSHIDLLYFGPAHTDGDLVVFFPEEKVAFVGDLIFMDRDQLIHLAKNGTSFGLVKALRGVLALDADVFVPGHGGLATKKDIGALIDRIEGAQKKVAALLNEGKTLEEVKAAFGGDDKAAPQAATRWMGLIEVIYHDLIEKR